MSARLSTVSTRTPLRIISGSSSSAGDSTGGGEGTVASARGAAGSTADDDTELIANPLRPVAMPCAGEEVLPEEEEGATGTSWEKRQAVPLRQPALDR